MTSTPTTATGDTLRGYIGNVLPDLVGIRHDLHRHPELGYEEQRTSGVVRRELEAAGIEHVAGLAGGTGIVAHLPGTDGNAIGLRADMDALPITEETGLPYASSRPGTMHACGHDGHTSILIGVARVLARIAREHALPRPVTLVFQPAEEGGGGGRRMVEDGCLDGSVLGPPVERMFGLHGWPRLPLGTTATRPGPLLAASDVFEIRIVGRGSHAAFPHLGHDPIVAAGAIIGALQTIAARNADPVDPVVVSVTQINGGSAHNVIPDRVSLSGTVRTLLPQTQRLIMERLEALATRIAEGHGCHAEVEYTFHYPVTRNDPEAVATFMQTATDALGAARVEEVPHPYMGSEDFSYYGQAVPSCFFLLGLLAADRETMPDLHQATFDFNDDAIATGIELFCRVVLGQRLG